MLPSANGNKVTSKWRRKIGNRSKQKEANSSMWQAVEEKWQAYQDSRKTKAVRQEVKQISKVVNLMQSEENALYKLLEEINSINCSIGTIIKQASINGRNTAI